MSNYVVKPSSLMDFYTYLDRIILYICASEVEFEVGLSIDLL